MDAIIRELHRCMYPERYYSPAELDRIGISLVDGVYQWDADTLDALADVFARHATELRGVIEAQ